MAKDINIHVKAKDTGRTRQQLDEVGRSAKDVGAKTAEGGKQAAAATEKTTQKLTGMGRILETLKGQVLAFVGAFLGLQFVMKIITTLIQKLERIQQLQREIYEKSLSFAEIGQALEFQTGTRGRQMDWAAKAAALQKAGGLASPAVAQQMLISMDIAFAAQGGIKSPQVMGIAGQLAPFVGTAGLGPAEVSQLFKFAGAAGIAPTTAAYKQYFAQLQAAYTASQSTNFGQFLSGAQKGVTAYITQGGTLTEGLSAYGGAVAVTANEALAATLVEQVARLSGGGYERPRQAIEKGLGVSWETLSMNERMDALLRYVGGIPESRRAQVLAAQGFPMELTTGIGKMITPGAMRTMAATRRVVEGAAVSNLDAQTQAYLKSLLGKAKAAEADRAADVIEAGPEFASWQERLKTAREQHEILVAKGEDRWIRDKLEPYVMAIEYLQKDITAFEPSTEEERLRKEDLLYRIKTSMEMPTGLLTQFMGTGGQVGKLGYKWLEEFEALQNPTAGSTGQPVIINDNSVKYYPRVGVDDTGQGPRTFPPGVVP